MINQFIHFRHALPKSINRYKLCRREETLNSSSAAIRNFRFFKWLFLEHRWIKSAASGQHFRISILLQIQSERKIQKYYVITKS